MGIFNALTGRFHLVLTLQYSPPAGAGYYLAGWKRSFQHASDLLYHATDGQHALGTLFVCPDYLGSFLADIWLFNTAGDASADGRIWLPGTHAIFYDDEQKYPFTILHELGHYLYGLRDEYKHADGTDGASCIGRRPATPEEQDAVGDPFLAPRLPGACIMEGSDKDGDWFDGPFTRPGTVTEFCVECNHDRGPTGSDCDDGSPETNYDDQANDTRQSHSYQHAGPDPFEGTSCWSVMKKHYPGLTLPPKRPDPDPSTPAPPTIRWIELRGYVRIVIGFDNSRAFERAAPWAGPPLDRALRRWIRIAPRGERWGAVAISAKATSFGLVRLNPLLRKQARKYLETISPEPGTNLGKGLARAIQLIRRDGARSVTQAVVLISGSEHDTGLEPLDLLPELLEYGIRVFGVAIGPQADVARLSALCAGTGGKWYRVREPGLPGLPGMTVARAMHLIYADLHPAEGLVTVDAALPGDWPDDLPDPAGGGDAERAVQVEEGCREATFIAVDEQGRDRKFRLIDPDGKEWTETDPALRRTRRVKLPQAGVWKLAPPERPAKKNRKPRRLQFLVSARSDRLRLGFSSARSHYARGEEVTLAAQMSFGPDLLGIECVGIVTDPDGLRERVPFRNEPDGGLQTARFTAQREGEYLVQCVVRGREADVDAAAGADSATGPTRKRPRLRVPDFTRTASLTILVGKPYREEAHDPPLTLAPGERRKVEFDFGDRTWVPGVSRLHLGPGIEVLERPRKSLKSGRPAFLLKVAKTAPPGPRDGEVRTGVEGYAVPGLVTVEPV